MLMGFLFRKMDEHHPGTGLARPGGCVSDPVIGSDESAALDVGPPLGDLYGSATDQIAQHGGPKDRAVRLLAADDAHHVMRRQHIAVSDVSNKALALFTCEDALGGGHDEPHSSA